MSLDRSRIWTKSRNKGLDTGCHCFLRVSVHSLAEAPEGGREREREGRVYDH